MKKNIRWILIASLYSAATLFSQTTGINYIYTKNYPNGLENPAVQNLTTPEQPNSTSVQSIGYFNGWAQSILSISLSDESGQTIRTRQYYDSRGRAFIVSKPGSFSGNLNYSSLNLASYLASFSGGADSTFQRTVYFSDVQDRVQSLMPFGTAFHKNNRFQRFENAIDSTNRSIRQRVTDEDGQSQDVYVDKFGRKIMQITKMQTESADLKTIFQYDILGNLMWSMPPQTYAAKTNVVFVDSVVTPFGMINDGGECGTGGLQGLSQFKKGGNDLESRAPGDFENEAPNDPDNLILRYYRPADALSATVTISHRSQNGNCPYTLTLQYRLNGIGCWQQIGAGPHVITMGLFDSYVEVRRGFLSNDGSGCTQPTIFMKIYAVAEVLEMSKYKTNYRYDIQNRLIEKQSPDEGKSYYVYDPMGRLRFVQDENHRNNLVFNGQRSYWTYYKYDELGRMTEQGELTQNYPLDTLRFKAMTGRLRRDVTYTSWCDTVRRDTVVCFYEEKALPKKVDANLPPGMICDTLHLTEVFCHTDSTITFTPVDTLYGVRSFPTSTDNPLKTVVNQYDLYGSAGWNINPGTDSVNTGANPVNFPKTRLTRTKILDANTSPNTWSEECYTYDNYGRVSTRRVYIPELAQSKKFQYYYDASGRVLKTMYQDGVAAESFYQWFKYDNLSRLDSVFSSRTNNRATAVREAAYDYDNNHGGKVLTTKLGNNIQQVDYTYNSRDWLKYINDVNNIGTDKFALSLGYDTVGTDPRFNGNIAASASLVSGQSQYAYNYVYDKANRLTDANHSGNLFSEKTIGYDGNGNITALTRHLNSASATPITYNYDAAKPNQLKYVTGALADSFYYDANGNMTRDKLKGNFDYDYRNMPIKMYLNSGKVIHIAYDAGGQRTKFLRKSGSTTQDSSKIFMLGANGKVIAEYIYLSSTWKIDHYNIYGNELIGKVALIPATSGTVIKTGQINTSQTADSLNLQNSQIQSGGSVTLLAKNGIRVQSTFNSNGATVSLRPGVAAAGSGATGGFTDVRYYYLQDHLGSVRVTLKEDGSIDSWSDYYPFGKEARGSSTVNEPKEQFTGKERDYESGLDYFGARYYNSDIARWVSVDPLAGKFPSMSPFNYVYNNPIRVADPDGLSGNDMVKNGKQVSGTAYEYGGKNPIMPMGNEDLGSLKAAVDRSNQPGNSAWKNYGDFYGPSNVNGMNVMYSIGMDCSGFYSFAFNSNPDLPGALKVNPGLQDVDAWVDYFSNNGNSNYVGEDGNAFLSYDTDINSANIKVGDAVIFNEKESHIGMITGVDRDKDGNVTNLYTEEAPRPGENVGARKRSAADLKKAGFSGYGIINQKEEGSSKITEKQ